MDHLQMAALQLHADRTAQLRELRRPRKDRRSLGARIHLPVPAFHWPFRRVQTAGNAPGCS